MDIKNKLLAYGKKSITLEALTDLLKADLADTKGLYDRIPNWLALQFWNQ